MGANNNSQQKPHSAEYFGAYRNFWWNPDFLQLMGTRLRLNRIETVLDVGCGIGHWGQTLASILPQTAKVIGVDREDVWLAQAADRARNLGLSERYRYQKGDVTQLSFEDSMFDLVTCQTVLIHLKDPKQGLKEMLRVLKPEGLLLAVEPNNFANSAVMSNLSEESSIEEIVELLRFKLTCERGKKALGLGFDSVGDLIPGYLAELSAQEIRVYVSDKATPLFPPYSSQEQQASVRQTLEWSKREFWVWDHDETHKYFLVGGRIPDDFKRLWALAMRDTKNVCSAISAGTYHSAGGSLMYLIAARKPLG